MKRKTIFFISTAALLAISVLLLGDWDYRRAVADTPESWPIEDPLPEPLGGVLVHCPDMPDSFFVVGGIQEDGLSSSHLIRYDINVGSEYLTEMPEPRRAQGSVCYLGKIYVAGGVNTGSDPISDSFYIYDIANNSWSLGPVLPNPVWGAYLGAWDGKLYLVGGTRGWDPYTPVDRVDIFDISTGEWVTEGGQAMLTPSSFYGFAQAGPYLYVVGGYSGDPAHNVNQTQRYNMQDDIWETGPGFTSARALGSLAVTASSLYMLGGDLDGGSFFEATNLVEVLDLSAWPGGIWINLGDPLPEPNLYPSTTCTEVLTGGEIWSVGGIDDAFTPLEEVYYRPTGEACISYGVELFAPEGVRGEIGESVEYEITITNTGTITDYYHLAMSSTWPAEAVFDLPLSPGESTQVLLTVTVPDDLWGGELGVTEVTATSLSDPTTQDSASVTTTATGWHHLEPIPHALGLSIHVQCATDPDGLYILGGADDWGSPTDLAYRYDVVENTWTALANLPYAGYGLSGVCVDGKIYVVDWAQFLRIYDTTTDTWTTEAGVPRFTEGAALGVWGGKLFLVGGTLDLSTYLATAQVDIYDIASHSWTAGGGTPMPFAVDYAGAAQMGPYLYLVGGMRDYVSEVYYTQRYDMSTDSWLVANYPSGMVFPSLTVTSEYLYVMGGDPAGDIYWTSTDLVERLALDTWSLGNWEVYNDPLLIPSLGASSFCTNQLTGGEIWHIGGGSITEDDARVLTDTLYHHVEPCWAAGVLLSPEMMQASAFAGETITYTLRLTNTGDTKDIFSLSLDEIEWAVTMPITSVVVEAGEGVDVLVVVTIPEAALPGDWDAIELVATSQSDPSVQDVSTIVSTVYVWKIYLPIMAKE